ncbi:hypothetical protein RW115_01240 [Macrococcus capreoli]
MFEDTVYGGFYTITGKCKNYIHITGTDEWNKVVTGKVPKKIFYETFKEVRND